MQLQLCGGHSLGAELVLEAHHLNALVLAVAVVREGGEVVGVLRGGRVLVLHVDVEEREASAASLRAAVLLHNPSQRECHGRGRGGGEELVAVQCIHTLALPCCCAIVLSHLEEGVARQLLWGCGPCKGAGVAHVRASRALCHPLATGGEHIRVARQNALQRPLLQGFVATQLGQSGRTVRHSLDRVRA